MKSPGSASGIKDAWVEFIIQQHEAKTNSSAVVTLSTFNVEMATKPGESFNAELVKVDATAKVTSDAEGEVEKTYNFIAKFFSQDPMNREMVKAVGYHVREYMMYSQVLPELDKHWQEHTLNKQGDQKINVPAYIYGVCSSTEYVLVLQNCKTIGFESNDKHKGLDFNQTSMAVSHVARLHALSYSYNQTSPIVDKYPCIGKIKFTFKPLVLAVFENTIRYVKSLPNRGEMLKKLEKAKHTIPRKFESMFEDPSRYPIKTLTHGDFWNSNLLFKYSDPLNKTDSNVRNLEDIKLLDWQITQWSNPVFDLHYLLNTSTNATLREQHMNNILRIYHNMFTSITESLNSPVPDWNYDQFKAEFDRTQLVGFLMGMCLIQGTLSKAGEKLNPHISGTSIGGRKSVLHMMKSAAAKVFVPILLKPSSQFIIKSVMKKLLEPIGQELVEGSNKSMNDRLLELLDEAEKKGLLDVLCI